MTSRLEVLLLCDRRFDAATTVREHIDHLAQGSAHHCRYLSVFGKLPSNLDLDRFDAIIIHYSLMADPDVLLPPAMCKQIAESRAVKAVFVQDEHRDVRRRIELLRDLQTRVLFTCVPSSEIEKVYPQSELPDVRKVNVLTGYVSPDLVSMSVPSFQDRAIDVGYRAREVQAWLGRLGKEKAEIGKRFAADAKSYDLVVDISVAEHDRLYGSKWIDFLANCKATLGSESGASVFDWDGSLEKQVQSYVLTHPDAAFDDISEIYFSHLDGQVANGQISPRLFEAAALRSLMVLYPGSYSGVLRPWDHYVPLARDHSNMAEVVDVLRDAGRAEEIIVRAYREVAQNPAYGFGVMVQLIDGALTEATALRDRSTGYANSEWAVVSRQDFTSLARRFVRSVRDGAVTLAFRFVASATSPSFAGHLKTKLRRLRQKLQ